MKKWLVVVGKGHPQGWAASRVADHHVQNVPGANGEQGSLEGITL